MTGRERRRRRQNKQGKYHNKKFKVQGQNKIHAVHTKIEIARRLVENRCSGRILRMRYPS